MMPLLIFKGIIYRGNLLLALTTLTLPLNKIGFKLKIPDVTFYLNENYYLGTIIFKKAIIINLSGEPDSL